MIYRNLTLEGLVEELKAQDAKKRDLVVPSRTLKMETAELLLNGNYLDGQNIVPNEVAHRQLAEKLGIPWNYYSKCRGNNDGGLLDKNVNDWLARDSRSFLVRTFNEGDYALGRAVLSDRFKPIDNLPILFSVLHAVKDSGLNLQVETADISEQKLYVRFIAPDIKTSGKELLKQYKNPGDMSAGDGIITGFVLKNSEVGKGMFSIAPRATVLVCRNGMVRDKNVFEVKHLGAKLDEGEYIWSNRTERFNQDLIKSQIQDWVTNFTTKEYLESWIAELEAAGTRELMHPVDTVTNVTKAFSMSEKAQNDVLNYFVKSGDLRAFGVTQALTYHAHQQPDPDFRDELEAKAVAVLDDIRRYDKASLNLL